MKVLASYILVVSSCLLCDSTGIKVFETNENELVMEPIIKWAGNQNIVVVLTLLSLRITVQVR